MGARYFCVNIDDWREQTIATILDIYTQRRDREKNNNTTKEQEQRIKNIYKTKTHFQQMKNR